MTGQVYVIGSPGNWTVKIGVSVDLVRRLREIQNSSPVKLAVLWSTPGGLALEQALHDHFAGIRSHGEWFAFTSDPVRAVQAALGSGSVVVPSPVLPEKRSFRQPPPFDADLHFQRLTWDAFANSRFSAGDAAERLGYTLPSVLACLESLVAKGRAVQRQPIRSERSHQLFTVRCPA
ncbi:GIY-YIG nuclease family protein [Streptomyces sp. TRM 70351]|uniref:GIY-YIG nuclease family protein n=1 Tax=Streptomyces sp. TRM 70351 TaxID=3116552 RepID=UPI002E7AD435|nr:GIY-YIG nuclease family protein [Streptomyces sp. TRM 70351]MEE1931425.1 GIY-YIG nuclease family protein [Streptomyces sp. TRM 70351]